MPLEVGIIGAGIAGLSSAIALRRTGARVEIYEKSQFKNEIGAAITVTPNGMRVLDGWGFDSAKARAIDGEQIALISGYTLEPKVVQLFGDTEAQYGHKMKFFHRVDLHATLRETAESPEGQPGEPVRIRLGRSVKDVDCEQGIIFLEDGTSVQKDLVIIADGAWASTPLAESPYAQKITGKEQRLEHTGSSIYRCLLPMDQVMANEELRRVWENKPVGYWVPFDLPSKFYLVTYECRNREVLNVAIRHKTRPKDQAKEEWNATASLDDVLETLQGYHPILPQLLAMSTSIAVHKTQRRDPLDQYTRGRAVIVGDAAHPYAPTHAQGAVLAIEEAGVLEVLFSGAETPDEIRSRLDDYEKLMKRYIHVTQLLSDAISGVQGDPYRKKAEEVWGEEMFPATSMNFSKPVRDFFYSRDVPGEAKKLRS
ncbi:FAD/NAD(P)-binding domain-containing protein [Thozetella sp. PMI_491]|nr:FAD/NAD(P)-binding domain-containing protein [Thozetella sp. PMI_491]